MGSLETNIHHWINFKQFFFFFIDLYIRVSSMKIQEVNLGAYVL